MPKKASHSKRKTRIRFAEDENLCETETCPAVELDNYRNVWYFPDDYQAFKDQARRAAREWKKLGLGVLLKDTFDSPRPESQDCINAYTKQGGSSRRGLERWINSQHGKERAHFKSECISSVVTYQNKMKRRGLKSDVIERELAGISLSFSRRAKVFARRIGKADAIAATCALEEKTETRQPRQARRSSTSFDSMGDSQHKKTTRARRSSLSHAPSFSMKGYRSSAQRRLSIATVSATSEYKSEYEPPPLSPAGPIEELHCVAW